MAIPFSDSPYILNAKKFSGVPTNSTPIGICNGRGVPMQFTFQGVLTWQVDMTQGAPNPPLPNGIKSVFIDASLSLHDVFIYFPDTGFVQLCPAGNTIFSPVLKQKDLFYIGIAPFFFGEAYPSDLVLPNVDLVNLIAVDVVLPPLVNNAVIVARNVGMPGDNFDPVYKFYPDTFYESNQGISGSASGNFDIIASNSWFFTGLDISFVGNSDNGDTQNVIFTLKDNITVLMTKRIVISAELQLYQIFDKEDLNYRSSNTGHLTISYSASTNISGNLSNNVFGGLFL